MADKYMQQATRDASLQLQPELDALDTMLADAIQGAKSGEREVNAWAQGSLDDLMSTYGEEIYELASMMTQSNMGPKSGMRSAGMSRLAATKQEGANKIANTKMNQLMSIAEQLDAVEREVGRGRQSLGKQKGLLIGQLADKYRMDAEQLAMQKENIRLQRLGIEQGNNQWAAEMRAKGYNTDGTLIGGQANPEHAQQIYAFSHERDPDTGQLTHTLADVGQFAAALQQGSNDLSPYQNMLPPEMLPGQDSIRAGYTSPTSDNRSNFLTDTWSERIAFANPGNAQTPLGSFGKAQMATSPLFWALQLLGSGIGWATTPYARDNDD